MNRIASRTAITLLLVFLLLAGFAFFIAEFIIEADEWVMFAGSPHIYNGGNIGTGEVIDREGNLLLDMNGGRTYSDSSGLRKSTVHWVGDRNGSVSAPALPNYSAQMAGYDLLNGVYHYGEEGGIAQLTLAGSVQKAALEAMGSYKGTVAVYNYNTGELLCAVTTPTFDPDNVPDVENDTTGAYEGIFYNRFTQSTYIPGSIFKIVTAAAALEEIPDIMDQTFQCSGAYRIDGDDITCENRHGNQDLKQAFRNSCNCAFAQIALQVGARNMEKYAAKFGLTEPLTFDGITTATGNYEAQGASDFNLGWSGTGQYNDQVNPCAFLTFVGAVARGGKGALPYVVEQIIVENSRTYSAKTEITNRVVSEETAELLREFMRNNVESKYGDENFPGLTVCAKTGTAEVGGDKKPNAMLAGFVADEEYPLAFIVCVEDGGYGKDVCIPIASIVLSACKYFLYRE